MDCGGNNYMTDRIVIAQLVKTSHECVGKANVVGHGAEIQCW
jgi:hypothetical protein